MCNLCQQSSICSVPESPGQNNPCNEYTFCGRLKTSSPDGPTCYSCKKSEIIHELCPVAGCKESTIKYLLLQKDLCKEKCDCEDPWTKGTWGKVPFADMSFVEEQDDEELLQLLGLLKDGSPEISLDDLVNATNYFYNTTCAEEWYHVEFVRKSLIRMSIKQMNEVKKEERKKKRQHVAHHRDFNKGEKVKKHLLKKDLEYLLETVKTHHDNGGVKHKAMLYYEPFHSEKKWTWSSFVPDDGSAGLIAKLQLLGMKPIFGVWNMKLIDHIIQGGPAPNHVYTPSEFLKLEKSLDRLIQSKELQSKKELYGTKSTHVLSAD